MGKDNLDGWEGYTGSNFLKPKDVLSETDAFICINVDEFSDDNGNLKPRLALTKKDAEFNFDLNVTNSNFCKNAGLKSPRMLIGKKICFKKVMVNSPKTKMEVESLRICKIE